MTKGKSPKPPSVLHVVASTRRRGAEVFAVDLSAALAERGFPGRLISLTGGGPLPVDVVGRGRFHLSTLLRLRREIVASSVVVAHGSSTLLATALAAGRSSIPFVYRNIGDPDHWVDTRLRSARVGILLRRAAGIVALWPGARARLIERHRLQPDLVSVVPNGVRSAGFDLIASSERTAARARFGVPEEAPVVAFIGSLTEEKAPHLAIRSTSRIPNAQLLIAGDGPLRADLERAADCSMPGRVTFLSTLEDVRPVLAAADVLALTSTTEGLPAVLVEAGLCGIPVVATRVGGIPEIVEDGVTGVVVEPGDERAVAAGMETAIASKEVMGQAAHHRCSARFRLDVVADEWASTLERVLERADANR